MTDFDLTIVSTGGTIEKTYEAASGSLSNRETVLDHMLAQLRIPDLQITRLRLMNKDSLEMTKPKITYSSPGPPMKLRGTATA